MSASPLQQALEWWSRQDNMGGFKTVAAILFPGWIPARSCRAPHREDKSASFSVYQNERGEWCFKDHSTGEQGRLVGFAMLDGMDEKTASRWVMDNAGITPQQVGSIPLSPRSQAKPQSPAKLAPMPVEAIARWSEGVDFLESNPATVEHIAIWRGWPVEFARYLAECATISSPVYHGERGIGFLVSVPESVNGRLAMRDIGFHCRLKQKEAGKKASWRFIPSESEHRQSTPALPFIIGGSWFDSARLLVITEGQWDALTFALAAGWLGEGCLWPEGVCVIGIRGASGANTFLQYYRQFWPANADCLLFPDGDGTGGKWFEGENTFADRLAGLCRKVAVVGCGDHKDFNDLYRAEKVTPEQVSELLHTHSIALESEARA